MQITQKSLLTRRDGVSEDTSKYRLEESVSHRRIQQLTQLFTYLLTHKLFTSCIRRYLVWRACDWVMSALSAALLIFSFQFSLLLFHGSPGTGTDFNTQYYTLYVAKNLGRYLLCMERTAQGTRFWIDSSGHKLAPYGTDRDGRLFTTDVCAKIKVTCIRTDVYLRSALLGRLCRKIDLTWKLDIP